MSKRILVSRQIRKVNPAAAFIFSAAVTGLGEAYTGSLTQGAVMMLLRALSLISVPFFSTVHIRNSYIEETAISLLAALAITLASPIVSFARAASNRGRPLKSYNTYRFYGLYSVMALCITGISLSVFLSFFSIQKLESSSAPLYEPGDIILVKKMNKNGFSRGESVFVAGKSGSEILRIIAVPGERAVYRNSRFSVDSSELPVTVFSEEELLKIRISTYDVICEQNGYKKYPIIQPSEKNRLRISGNQKEYFAAPDNRSLRDLFKNIRPEDVEGRVEGLLISGKEFHLPSPPFLTGESVEKYN